MKGQDSRERSKGWEIGSTSPNPAASRWEDRGKSPRETKGKYGVGNATREAIKREARQRVK